MSTINVKSGVQFQAALYDKPNHTEWLEAVGKELEAKGLTIKIGEGANAKLVSNATQLIAKFAEIKRGAATAAAKAYVTDLLQAIDDVVKPGAVTARGDSFDFSRGSAASVALGVDDGKRSNYAAKTTTPFGRAAQTKPEGTLVIDGATFQTIDGVRPPPSGGIDLSQIPHMSVESLRNAPVTWGRDGEEVEDTRVITGLTRDETVALATNSLDDLQASKAAIGQTLGAVPLDEMTWDSDSHALRRSNPYVSFTLDEGRSIQRSPRSGEPRLGIGRDYFFDTFMAKKDLTTGKLTTALQDAALMYRTRIRYGTTTDPFQGTRVLIGMKEGTSIDPDGTKHARKIDNRTDSANQTIFDTLNVSAMSGKIDPSWSWGGGGDVAPAAAAMYRVAVQKNITDNIGGETNVLAMEPGAVARQIRGRFHLNETDQSALVSGLRESGEPRIKELLTMITSATDWAANGALPSKADLVKQANGLLDRSSVIAAAKAGLEQIKPGVTVNKALIDSLWPDKETPTKEAAKMQRVVADAIRQQYDLFAEGIDQAQRQIGGTTERAVRDAGSASDVREFFRQKSAEAAFLASNRTPAAAIAALKAYNDLPETTDAEREAKKVKGEEIVERLSIGINHLRAMTPESLQSAVKVDGQLVKKQTIEPFMAAFDKQLAGPNKDAFTAELAAFLARKNSATLSNATDKTKVLGDIRKNLATAHAEILHRQVEAAGAWGQAAWFNNYRETMLGINPQGWNFIIGSMDYTEFYDAETGKNLTFKERVSRVPLDASRMKGAMISNDFQIELQAEEGYTESIRRAQYGINAATAGLAMDYALSKNVPGLTAGDAEAFEKWFAAQATLPAAQRRSFDTELSAFARAKGSPIDVAKSIDKLAEQEQAIRLLAGFAKIKNPALNLTDRDALQTWVQEQGSLPEAELNAFLTELARYAAEQKSTVALSPTLLRSLDFKPFAGTNVGQTIATHAGLVEDFNAATEVWSMVKEAQRNLSVARGQDVQRVLRSNNLTGKTWDPPTKAKGDYAIDFVLR